MAAARDRRTGAARDALLRDVLELTVSVLRAAADDDPSSVPPALRRVLPMAKLGSRALRTVDRAGDDAGLRARVTEAAREVDVGPAGRLWLERPEGWEEALDRLVAERAAADDEEAAAREAERERRARRRAEEVRDRARDDAERARAELEGARRRLAEARAEAAAATARAEEADQARRRAVQELAALKDAHGRAHAELRALRSDLESLREELAAARAAPGGDDRAAGARPDPTSPPAPTPVADVAAVAGEVARAAELAGVLGEVLGDLADRLAPPEDHGGRAPGRAATGPGPRRRPARLPGGVHDDSPEAAAHLVRRPGAVLLVDGYNVALASWPDLPLPEQRERLLASLDALEARTGLDVTVVFDGVEEASVGRSPSRRVTVRFTPEGLEADDDILATIDALPPAVPVLVASDDRRVRDGARARGANVLSVDQLRSQLG